jgi:hypothetical protein
MNSTRNKKIYEELVSWSEQYDWDVFGTVTFAPRHKLHGDEAQQLFRRYWNGIDRAVYGQRTKSRVERVVCLQLGALGDNTHLHFLAKSPIKIERFCMHLSAIWTDVSVHTAPVVENVILPVIDVRSASRYIFHEFHSIGVDTLNLGLCHRNYERWDGSAPTPPHAQAEQRLANQSCALTKVRASLAFIQHEQDARAKYQKRHG